MSEPDTLIYGMTPATAENYKVVRQQIDLLLTRVRNAGHWLSVYDLTINPQCPGTTLTQTGRAIIHDITLIHHYLEDEFASVRKVSDALDNLKK